jgi:hypothetical protein
MRLFLQMAAAVCLGLLVVSLTPAQEPLPEPVDDQAPPDVEEYLKRLPPDTPPEKREQYRQMIKQYLEQLKQRPDGFPMGGPPMGGFPMGGPPGFRNPGLSRLGADVHTPPASLVEQLDLPKGQGLLLGEVRNGTAAAKAGLKTHDVLLEVDGKAVPRDLKEFGQSLSKIKEDTPVNVTILRKGMKETIKGLSLPKATETPMGFPDGFRPPDGFKPPDGFRPPDGFKPPDGFPMGGFPMGGFPMGGFPMGGFPMGGGQGVITTVIRTSEGFTARHQEGSLIITLVGAASKVSEISVQDGRESNKYESAEKVPTAYRDKVKNLVDMLEKSNAKIEIKTKEPPKEKDPPKDKEPVKDK